MTPGERPPDAAPSEPSSDLPWQVLRDPARPMWPGVLVVSPDNNTVIPVATGAPPNFADSFDMALTVAAALGGGKYRVNFSSPPTGGGPS